MGKRSIEFIYGMNPCFEVLLAGRRNVKQAFLLEHSATDRMKKLAELICERGIPLQWVGKDRLHQLSKTGDHQGCVLRTGTYRYFPFRELLTADRLLLLDGVEDPHNVGAILRTAEVFGFNHVLLPEKGVPGIYPSVVKVSAGATEHLFISREMKSSTCVRHLKDAGFTVVALDASGDVPIDEVRSRTTGSFVLVIGGESRSVSAFVLRESDYVARITQQGRVNSLNASVAAAIGMYEMGGRK